MSGFGWHYPPGVTGNEPEITGIWPCGSCGGEGCWFCGNTGTHPEESPACPECDGTDTLTLARLKDYALKLGLALVETKYAVTPSESDRELIVVCFECGEVSR